MPSCITSSDLNFIEAVSERAELRDGDLTLVAVGLETGLETEGVGALIGEGVDLLSDEPADFIVELTLEVAVFAGDDTDEDGFDVEVGAGLLKVLACIFLP